MFEKIIKIGSQSPLKNKLAFYEDKQTKNIFSYIPH